MKLTDVLPLEKWIELEKEINRRSGLNASVFDINGIRIAISRNGPTGSVRSSRQMTKDKATYALLLT